MNYAKIFYKITIHLLRGSSTWSLLHCRSWIGSKRKEAKEGRQIFPRQWCVCTICLDNVPAKQESLRIQRNRGRWIINFIDDMSKIQKVLNLFVRNAETNFGRQSLSHHYVPVSTLEECVIKVVKENTEENDSQGNSRLERTRCNTPKYLRTSKFGRLCANTSVFKSVRACVVQTTTCTVIWGWHPQQWKQQSWQAKSHMEVVRFAGELHRCCDLHASVRWHWVRGHSRDLGNDLADALAKGWSSGSSVICGKYAHHVIWKPWFACVRVVCFFFLLLCCSLSSPRFCSCMCDPRAFVVYGLQVSPLFSAVGVASPSRQILGMLCTTFRRAPHGKACLCLHPKNVLSRWRAVSCGVPCPDSRVGKTFLSIFCDDSGESWRCGTTDLFSCPFTMSKRWWITAMWLIWHPSFLLVTVWHERSLALSRIVLFLVLASTRKVMLRETESNLQTWN